MNTAKDSVLYSQDRRVVLRRLLACQEENTEV